MNIVYISEAIKGGVASYFEEVIPELIARKMNITIIGPGEYIGNVNSDLQSIWMSPTRARGRLLNAFLMTLVLLFNFKKLKPDVIHCHSTYSGFFVRIFKPLFGKCVVIYSPHCWSFLMDKPKWQLIFFRWIEKVLQKRADVIVNVSKTEYNSALIAGLDPRNMVVNENGIRDIPSFKSGNHKKAGYKNILYAGRFCEQKGTDLLLKLISCSSNSDDLFFHVVGGDCSSWPTGMSDKYHSYGWMGRNEVISIINDCDIVVMPSRWEGLPILALEAMSLGKVVVANDIDVMREVLSGGAGIIADFSKPEDVKNILLSLRGDDIDKIGSYSRVKFEQNYHIDLHVNKLVNLYESKLRKIKF